MATGFDAGGCGGEVDVIRLTLEINDNTYIYQYPPEEALTMLDVLATQAVEGRVPFLAAQVLGELVLEGVQ
jgi:hypothetical protein